MQYRVEQEKEEVKAVGYLQEDITIKLVQAKNIIPVEGKEEITNTKN